MPRYASRDNTLMWPTDIGARSKTTASICHKCVRPNSQQFIDEAGSLSRMMVVAGFSRPLFTHDGENTDRKFSPRKTLIAIDPLQVPDNIAERNARMGSLAVQNTKCLSEES